MTIRAFDGATPRFGKETFVAESADVLGDVVLGAQVSIWCGAVLRGDVGKIRVGARSNIQDNATIHMTHQVSDALIGEDVIVAHNAVIHGALVEDRALIGMGAVIMDNARIGAGAWVAAGSVVPPGKVIAPGMLVRGSPAREIRPVSEEEQGWAKGASLRYLDLARKHSQAQAEAGTRPAGQPR